MRYSLLSLLAILPLGVLAAPMPAFVPMPASVSVAEGRFKLTEKTAIVAPAELANEAGYLADRLRTTAGLPAPVVSSGSGIVLALDKSLAEEGYALEVKAEGVVIRGGSAAGVFYGVQTYLQTLPPGVYGQDLVAKADWSSPLLTVSDAPTCAWRGVMLDSARHFQPVAFIKKFIDAMAAQKLNRFHWHLVDSEAWRLEIKKYPKLATVAEGAPAYYPNEIPTNPTFRAKYSYGHFHGGGYYTQDQVRDIVAYAASRHVTIVPEIEFPGHAMAALSAYPEFSTTRKVPAVRSNITPDLVGVHPEALQFLRDVLDETMDLFPGRWIHFGGDEAPKGQWKASAEVQRKIDELGLRVKEVDPKHPHASEEALQAWLFNRMADHIAKRGRRPAGWEEIMHGKNIDKLAPGSVIMPWLSTGNAVLSANKGYGVVYTSVGPFYLDSYQSREPGEPSALYDGPMTAQGIHRYNLFPAGLTPEGRKNVLGAQCQLWTELMPRPDDVEYQAYPRLCALAELTWTAPENRADTDLFMARLAAHGERLSALRLNHRRVTVAPGNGWTPASLTAVAAAGSPWTLKPDANLAKRLAAGEKLSVKFEYKSGGNGLDVLAVELLDGGKVVAADTHAGFAGTHSRDNAYTLVPPAGVKPGNLVVRIRAAGSGGNDSHGEVILSAAK